MAHSEQTKLQFIELRAQKKTLEEISAALNVCRRTLVHWNREFADDIADLREVERESMRRKLFGTTHDWMKGELHHYKRLDDELARRQFKYSPTESVFRMRAESRKTIEKFFFAESPLDRPRQGRVATPLATAPQSDGRDATPFTAPKSDEGGLASAHVLSATPEEPPATQAISRLSNLSSRVESQIQNPESGIENPSVSQPFPHQNPGGRDAAPSASASESSNVQSEILVVQPSVPSVASVIDPDPHNANAHDESIVIGPDESARSILERCGVKVPDHPNIRLVRPV